MTFPAKVILITATNLYLCVDPFFTRIHKNHVDLNRNAVEGVGELGYLLILADLHAKIQV